MTVIRKLWPVALIALSGCQAVAQQPVSNSDAVSSGAWQQIEQQVERQQALVDERLSELGNRMTLVQEQLALLKQQGEVVALSTQGQAQRLEDLHQQLLQSGTGGDFEALRADLDQLLQHLEQRADEPVQEAEEAAEEEVEYRLVSTYTDQGRWVVLRYSELTGETWTIESGTWVGIEESEPLPVSRYQLVINAAAADRKGYVAARIDQLTGRSWWLKDNRWHPLEEG